MQLPRDMAERNWLQQALTKPLRDAIVEMSVMDQEEKNSGLLCDKLK